MKLFVGLGNPGTKYAHNRHNVGFMAVERIAGRHGFGPWKRKFQGYAADGELDGEKVLLLKPETYMNDSGRAAGEAARFLKIAPADIVVFHDELDLAPGKLKLKTGGGNAGHNGLRSMSAHLANDYARVRIGIGHPGVKELVHAWVLHDFSKADNDWLEPLLAAIADASPWLATGDHPRFLTDVARALQIEVEPAPVARPKATGDASGPPPPAPNSQPGTRKSAHPTGERMGKRQSALAENLKKWMAGRGKQDG